jgi:hypothetical protein
MDYDNERIDEVVLALLAAWAADDGHVWKGHDFEVMNRLHERGFINNPVNRNKSVYLTESGISRGRQLAEQWFSRNVERSD